MKLLSGIASWWRGNRNLNNPNLPLNDPAIWEAVFNDTFGTEAGESITHENALQYAPVWQAVSMISADVARLPLVLYHSRGKGDRKTGTPADDDFRMRLVQMEPNEEVDAYQLWRRAMVDALLWGNLYIVIERDGGGAAIGLRNVSAGEMALQRVNGDLFFFEGNDRVPHLPGDVIHVRGVANSILGLDLVKTARNSIALGVAQEKYASRFFRSGGRVGGILELPAGMPKPVRDTVEEGFRKTYEGTENSFKTVILRDSAKFHSAQVSPRDSQMIEGTEAQVRRIAQWFNLPPSKLGLADANSFASKAEDNQNYLETTLAPWLKAIKSQLDLKLLDEREQAAMFFDHDTSELLRMNALQRHQVYAIGIQTRIYSPNECRAWENMLPYEGGDDFANPNTTAGSFMPEGGAPTLPTVDPVMPPLDSTPEPARADAVRLAAIRRVVFEVGQAARHRASKGGKSFCDWIDFNWPELRASAKAIEWDGINEIYERMQQIARTANADTLAGKVEQTMALIEQEF
jgi:HK97 family phage portal protein